MENHQKVIFITGASSGIGRETALTLAKKGYRVFAGIRKKIDKTELENLNSNITGVYVDITSESSVDKAFWFVYKNTEKIDILINNAGIAVAGPIECLTVQQLKEQFDVNTFGAINVMQKFLPLLDNAKIINISSMAATGIFPFVAPYCASKSALDILFNSFGIENKSNIKVISVRPAVIKTPIWNKSVKRARNNFEEYNETAKEKYTKELLYLEKNALKNSDSGIEVKKVVETILKIINSKNPKPVYTVGAQAFFAEIISKMPKCFINYIIKNRIGKI